MVTLLLMHWSYHSLALSHQCLSLQDCGNSIANTLELPQSCTKPSNSIHCLVHVVTPLLMQWSYDSLALSHQWSIHGSVQCNSSVSVWSYHTKPWLIILGLMQDCGNSTAGAMELPQSCTKPWYLVWSSPLTASVPHAAIDMSIP